MVQEKLDEIRKIIDNLTVDIDKFESRNNNAAGTRIRKAMQNVKNIAQETRIQIQDIKNERKG